MSLDEALMRLSEESGINIVYDSDVTRNIRVNGSAANQTIEAILQNLLSQTPLQYRISEAGTYIIYRARAGMRRTGGIAGVVVDHRTGEPVEGVNIYIESAQRGSTTDSGGRYLIERLEPGDYQLRVSHVSYSPVIQTTRVLRGLTQQSDFRLRRAVLTETQVIITDAISPLQYMRAGRDVVEPGAILLQTSAGTPDVMRALADVPGVRFQNPLSDMVVQGSNATNHRIKLDGTIVFSPLSMGRLLSAFSPYAVRRLTLHRAGFPASMGSSLSGVVSVEQSAMLPGDDPYLFQSDFNSMNARTLQQWDLPSNEQLYLMAALRIKSPWSGYNPSTNRIFNSFNTPDQPLLARKTEAFSNGIMDNVNSKSYELAFYDLHLSMLHRMPDLSTTSFTAYLGENSLSPSVSATNGFSNGLTTIDFFDEYRWQNQIVNVRHMRLVSDEGSMAAVLRVSRHQYRQDYMANSTTENQADPVLLYEDDFAHGAAFVSAQLDYSHEWSNRLELLTGLDLGFSSISMDVSDFLTESVSIDELQVQSAGFGEIKWNPGEHSRFIVGSRITHIPGLGVFAEPRISFGIDFPEVETGNWSLEIAGGLFREYLQQLVLSNTSPNGIFAENNFWLPAKSTGIVPESWHVAVDIRWQPMEQLIVRLDPYYKWQPLEAVVDYAATGTITNGENGFSISSALINARSYTFGLGLNLEYVQNKMVLNALYNMSHVRQRTENRYDNRYIRPYWAEPHQIILNTRYQLFQNVSTNARLEILPGKRGWAYRQAYYTNLAYEDNNWAGRFDSPQSDKLGTYSQLDIGVNWSRRFSSSNWSISAELQNLLGTGNVYDRGLRSASGNGMINTYSRSIGHIQPGVSVQVSF